MCKNLSPRDAYRMIRSDPEVEVLDVRTPMEYHRDGRIPGARLMPLSELQWRLKELDPTKKYLVYCRTGNRSGQVCRFLAALGFNMYNMGGVVQWARYGLPLEEGERYPGPSISEGPLGTAKL